MLELGGGVIVELALVEVGEVVDFELVDVLLVEDVFELVKSEVVEDFDEVVLEEVEVEVVVVVAVPGRHW